VCLCVRALLLVARVYCVYCDCNNYCYVFYCYVFYCYVFYCYVFCLSLLLAAAGARFPCVWAAATPAHGGGGGGGGGGAGGG
jgi:hypothetical protein